MEQNILIISRHEGLVQWLSEQGITGQVVAHATPELVSGKIVYGNMPLNLCALTDQVWAVDMNVPAEKRGQELTCQDLKDFGAKLSGFTVRKI